MKTTKNKLKDSQSKMSEFEFNSMIPSKKATNFYNLVT